MFPNRQARQARSELRVGLVFSSSPARQTVTLRHAAVDFPGWKVCPAEHGAQMRSAAGVGSRASPVPAAHTDVFWQRDCPVVALNLPVAHPAHVRSVVTVGAASSSFPGGHLSAAMQAWVPVALGWETKRNQHSGQQNCITVATNTFMCVFLQRAALSRGFPVRKKKNTTGFFWRWRGGGLFVGWDLVRGGAARRTRAISFGRRGLLLLPARATLRDGFAGALAWLVLEEPARTHHTFAVPRTRRLDALLLAGLALRYSIALDLAPRKENKGTQWIYYRGCNIVATCTTCPGYE